MCKDGAAKPDVDQTFTRVRRLLGEQGGKGGGIGEKRKGLKKNKRTEYRVMNTCLRKTGDP